jgi:hypothetical protein
VVNCYPSFNEKIVEKTTSSKEQVNIKVTGSNIEEVEQSFGIEVKGRNEFMYTSMPADEIRTMGDQFDNMDLLTCYVTPEDPVIKYYTQKIQEKVLKGEQAVVVQTPQEGLRVLAGIYNATLMSHMVYSGTSGVPLKVGDVQSTVQSIRLPREVVTGKTGLCIELTLLYASILMNAGLDPIIYLVPGHAYPGFRMNGSYYAIESTGIGGEGLANKKNPTGKYSAEQALQMGMNSIEEFIKGAQSGDDRYRIIDVRESISKGAVAMELKDDTYLRQKIDEIAKDFETRTPNVNNVAPPENAMNPGNEGGNAPDNGGGGSTPDDSGGGNTNTSVPSGYKLYQGPVSFAYPRTWKVHARNAESGPYLKQWISNNDNSAYIEVYQFNGISNPTQGIQAVQQRVAQYGGQLQYKSHGQSNGFSLYSGQTFYGENSINWMAAFKVTGNGVEGIAAGANGMVGTKHNQTLNKILNSVR